MQRNEGARLLHLLQDALVLDQVLLVAPLRQPQLLHGQVLGQVAAPAVQQRPGHQAGHAGPGPVLPAGEDADEEDQDEVPGRVEDVEGGEEEQEVRLHRGVLHVIEEEGEGFVGDPRGSVSRVLIVRVGWSNTKLPFMFLLVFFFYC